MESALVKVSLYNFSFRSSLVGHVNVGLQRVNVTNVNDVIGRFLRSYDFASQTSTRIKFLTNSSVDVSLELSD